MENNLKFNSAICTSREQSERLLALGLKKETADCFHWRYLDNNYIGNLFGERLSEGDTPAWSLHRLIEMLNFQVIHNGEKYEPVIAIDGMAYQEVCDDDPIVGWSGDLYTDVIDCIEWLIGKGYFYKEYLQRI